jgi:GGDEF domain-containing protein
LCLYRRQKDSFSRSELKSLEQSILRLHEPFCHSEPVPAVQTADNGRFFKPLDYASLDAALHKDAVALIRIDLDRVASRPEIAATDSADRLVRTCCEVIRKAFPADVLAQIAGTEFAVVASPGAEGELDRRVGALRASLASVADGQFQVAIGVAEPEPGASVGDVLAIAERAVIEDRHRRATGDLQQLDWAVRAEALIATFPGISSPVSNLS